LNIPRLPSAETLFGKHFRGIVYAAIAGAFWGTVFPVGKLLEDVNPLVLALGRFAIGALLLWGVVLFSHTFPGWAMFRKHALRLVWLGATGCFAMGTLGFWSVQYTSPTNTAILMNSNPLLVVLLGGLIGEKLSARRLIGVLIGIAGSALVVLACTPETNVGTSKSEHVFGSLLALGSALSWAVYTLGGKSVVREMDNVFVTAAASTTGSLLLVLTIIAGGMSIPIHTRFVVAVTFLGVFPTAIGFALWYAALKYADAGEIAPLQYLGPIVTAIMSVTMLGDKLVVGQVVGMTLVFAGIYISTIMPVKADRSKQEGAKKDCEL